MNWSSALPSRRRHLLLMLGRQRRMLRTQDLSGLAQLLRDEAQLAVQGLASASGEKQSDHLWAVEALLLSADLLLRAGDPKRSRGRWSPRRSLSIPKPK